MNLVLLHSVNEAANIVGPLLCLEQVDLACFYEHSQMLIHRNHFFAGLVFDLCLQLGIELLDFSGANQICAGVVIVENFHCHEPAFSVFFWDELLADDVGET